VRAFEILVITAGKSIRRFLHKFDIFLSKNVFFHQLIHPTIDRVAYFSTTRKGWLQSSSPGGGGLPP
jgi:hypothetical protein